MIVEKRPGAAAARNTGIRAAKGALLAFTDDDCRFSQSYFMNLLKCDEADAVPVLRGGRVELGDPTDLPLTIKTDDHVQHWSLAQQSARFDNPGNALFSCNMAMRAAVIGRIGYLDERLGVGTGIGSMISGSMRRQSTSSFERRSTS